MSRPRENRVSCRMRESGWSLKTQHGTEAVEKKRCRPRSRQGFAFMLTWTVYSVVLLLLKNLVIKSLCFLCRAPLSAAV